MSAVLEGTIMSMGKLPDDAPIFCPLCGRALFYSYWEANGGGERYNYFVCFNGRGPWYRWFREKIKTTEVGGVHYRYQFGRSTNNLEHQFDSQTGKRLP